jgi:hypothetical protein
MLDTKILKKLHIKLPYEIGKPHYISKLPTKKDFQKLIIYRLVFLLICLLGIYLMYDYSQELFHPARYKYMNDGSIIDMTYSLFILYLFMALALCIKLFTYSFKLYVVGDKGCVVYKFKTSKYYTTKQKLFSDNNFRLNDTLEEFEDEEYQETLAQMYDYFKIRRKK